MSQFHMSLPDVNRHELRVAREFYQRITATFQEPNTWCRGWFAEGVDGGTCGPNNAKAAAFSLDGAVVKAMAQLKAEKVPLRLLDRACCLVNWTLIDAIWHGGHEIPHIRGPIQVWNDDICKGREEVLSVAELGQEILAGLKVRS